MKSCSRCGAEKGLGEFHRKRAAMDGYASHCKACEKARKASFYSENKEKVLQRTETYRRANLEKGRQATRRWKERNPEYIEAQREIARERTRAWNEANPERKKLADRCYYEKTYAKQAIYRNQGRSAASADEAAEDWIEIIRRDPCSYCGDVMQEIDHIDPVTRWHQQIPGWNSERNLTSSCQSCNRRKSARPFLMFLLLSS